MNNTNILTMNNVYTTIGIRPIIVGRSSGTGGGDYSLRDNRNIRQKTPAECGMSGTATDGADKKQASDLQITAAS